MMCPTMDHDTFVSSAQSKCSHMITWHTATRRVGATTASAGRWGAFSAPPGLVRGPEACPDGLNRTPHDTSLASHQGHCTKCMKTALFVGKSSFLGHQNVHSSRNKHISDIGIWPKMTFSRRKVAPSDFRERSRAVFWKTGFWQKQRSQH